MCRHPDELAVAFLSKATKKCFYRRNGAAETNGEAAVRLVGVRSTPTAAR